MDLELVEDREVILRQVITLDTNIVYITVTLGATDTILRSNGTGTRRGQRCNTETGYNF